MPQKKRVVRCELDGHFMEVLVRAKNHGYPTFADAVRAGLRLLDKDLSRGADDTLSPRAGGASLTQQLENHDCLRSKTCEQEA